MILFFFEKLVPEKKITRKGVVGRERFGRTYPESMDRLCTPSRFGCRLTRQPKRLGVHVRPIDSLYMYVQNDLAYRDKNLSRGTTPSLVIFFKVATFSKKNKNHSPPKPIFSN